MHSINFKDPQKLYVRNELRICVVKNVNSAKNVVNFSIFTAQLKVGEAHFKLEELCNCSNFFCNESKKDISVLLFFHLNRGCNFMDLNFIVFVRKVFAIKGSIVIWRSILKHKIVVKTIVSTEIFYFFPGKKRILQFLSVFRLNVVLMLER